MIKWNIKHIKINKIANDATTYQIPDVTIAHDTD